MSWSRRGALSALATGFATAVAGCQSDDDVAGPPDEPEPDRVEPTAVRQVRVDEAAVLFTEADTLPTPDKTSRRHRRASAYIASRAEFEEFSWGETPEARQLREFVETTDFEERSVYLLSTVVDACHEVHLVSMSRDPDDDPSGDFCTGLRPADVACDTDDDDTVGFAVRLPYTVPSSSGHGTGMSSRCRGPTRPPAFQATVVPRNRSDGS
ncbi:hypothetical protein [Haloarcula sp. 1CSR25-25]|uniref:hypothetical protein n=1 Tax=Haloarcula sp. 1CSR25-25 TaxID=2862545 RepID=UPI002895D490|nr:hypothetical protein [Haloarcula sp. 1CSR25-25]MDT3435901.1 hypothetical protein [Haloarcula sp. 1CSR25-25]